MENSRTPQAIDIQKLVNDHPLSGYQILIFILCFLIILMDGFDTGSIGFVAPSLLKDWAIEKSHLSPVFSAALIGMAVGALTVGPFADRFGRKKVIVVTVFFFGLCAYFSAYTSNIIELSTTRFLTGLGLGAAMPTTATLLAEYMPHRIRAMTVNTIFCAFPLGIAIGGFASAHMIDFYGWTSVFIAGGVSPIILGLVLIIALPESLQFLQIKSINHKKIAPILNRITSNHFSIDQEYISPKNQIDNQQSGPSMIISAGFRATTFMLWIACFMSLLVFYLITSWLPIILKEAGFSTPNTSLLPAFFQVGGAIGTLIIGWLMDKTNANKTLMLSYVGSALLLLATGIFYGNLMLFTIALFLAGAGLGGAQSSMPALTAAFYPTQCRATGVSWMHGIGRFGAIFGAFFGSHLLLISDDFRIVFALLSVPIFIVSLALWEKGRLAKRSRTPA